MSLFLQTSYVRSSIYDVYQNKMVDPKTKRAREMCEVEKGNQDQMKKGDVREAKGIAQLYFKGAKLAALALQNRNLHQFDAVVGDHNCHVTGAFVLSLLQKESLDQEAESLLQVIQKKEGKINEIKSSKLKSPLAIIEENALDIGASEEMLYLIHLAILKVGTECFEHRNGTMTLKVDPGRIQQLAKSCSHSLIEKSVIAFREYSNAISIKIVQEAARRVLTRKEEESLQIVRSMKTYRGETMQFACAFYNAKAVLLSLINQGSYIALVPYNQARVVDKEQVILFGSTGESSGVECIEINEADLSTPVFVVQAFFSESHSMEVCCEELEKVGFISYFLASVATCPQFEDLKKEEYIDNQDLLVLPDEQQAEIARYRDLGRNYAYNGKIPSICHTYADVLANIITNKE